MKVKFCAKYLLETAPVGAFLIRVPESDKTSFALVLKTEGKLNNFKISLEDGVFKLGKEQSSSLFGLIMTLAAKKVSILTPG